MPRYSQYPVTIPREPRPLPNEYLDAKTDSPSTLHQRGPRNAITLQNKWLKARNIHTNSTSQFADHLSQKYILYKSVSFNAIQYWLRFLASFPPNNGSFIYGILLSNHRHHYMLICGIQRATLGISGALHQLAVHTADCFSKCICTFVFV